MPARTILIETTKGNSMKLGEIPVCPQERFNHYKKHNHLSLAYVRIVPLVALYCYCYCLSFYALSCYQMSYQITFIDFGVKPC